MKQLSCSMSAEAVERVGLMEEPPPPTRPTELSVTALPKSTLQFEIFWEVSLRFFNLFCFRTGCFLVPSCKEAANPQLRFPEEKFNFYTVTLWSGWVWFFSYAGTRTSIRKSRVDLFKLQKLELLQVQFFQSHCTAALCEPQTHPNFASAREGEKQNAKARVLSGSGINLQLLEWVNSE